MSGCWSQFKIRFCNARTGILGFCFLALSVTVPLGFTACVDTDTMFGIIGAVFAFTFFLMQNALETARFRRELFLQFNRKYDQLNDRLAKGLRHLNEGDQNEKTQYKDRQVFEDYFNLCGEEYHYYKKGYVEEKVWENWRRGMWWWYRQHWSIRRHWRMELAQGSYYGLTTDEINKGRPRRGAPKAVPDSHNDRPRATGQGESDGTA